MHPLSTMWVAGAVIMIVLLQNKCHKASKADGLRFWESCWQTGCISVLAMFIWPVYLLAMCVPEWRKAWNL